MNITKKKLINKVCAILMIMALTILDFLFVGKTVFTYAIDVVATNHANVDFSAYFLNENGEKVDKLEGIIDSGEKYLYVDISVKNEGYLNGTIRLNENNFVLKQEKLSENIAEISEKEVKLNQINAGSTVTIKLGIEPVKENIVNQKMLDTKTNVELQGQYVNSKNVENEKYVDIKGTAGVAVNWKSSENAKAELGAEILTNSIYEIDGAQKRIVQILVNSKITDNNYPVKSTEINLNVPEEVEDVKVHARSTKATTNTDFNENNYVYNHENNKLTVKLSNEDANNISWNKNVQDTVVVTYIFDKDQDVLNKEISVESKIHTYDEKELMSNQNVHIEKEIDGIVSYSVENIENEIYKGKLYTGEERLYKTINKVNVDYLNVAENITLVGKESKYIANESEKEANIIYKETKINKDEFLRIFGEDGYITIKNSEGKTIANIDKVSEVNEKGEIVINYSEETKQIELITSKPISLGILNVKNTKAILNKNYSREQINQITGIKETITANYNEKENTDKENLIKLNNTSSKALLDVSQTTLSATDKNENVKITAVLLNNDESRDLYKNPVVKIALPKQVIGVSAKCKVLYGNGLELGNAKIIKENNANVIEIALSGIQNTYNTETLEGTTIIIYANLEVDKLASNSDEEIKLTYTNEMATSFEDNGEETVPVKIVGNTGVITTNNIKEYNVETIGDEGTKTVTLDLLQEEKNATTDISIINNEGTEINNVSILGKFPTGEKANLGIKLASGINMKSNSSAVKVYYSDKENPTENLNDAQNNWKTEGDANTTKSYLILIDSMKEGEKLEANYEMTIPSNLTYNLEAQESYTVNYKNRLTDASKTAKATTLSLTTGTNAEIISNIKAYVGEDEITDGKTVYNGEVIRYELTVKNNGSEPATNVNAEINIPQNTTCVRYVKSAEPIEKEDAIVSTRDYYENVEVVDNKLTETIDTLGINEEKTITYEVKVNDEAVNNTISTNANIKYVGTKTNDNIITEHTNTITNTVSKAEIDMNLIMIARGTDNLRAGMSYSYELTVKNISGKKLSNVEVAIKTSNNYEIEKIFDKDKNEIKHENNKFIISSLNEGETVSFEIDVQTTSNKNGIATISAISNNLYRSNKITEIVKLIDLSVSMTSDNEGQIINSGDAVLYKTTVVNKGTEPIENIGISQEISTHLDVEKITINGEEVEFDTGYEEDDDDNVEDEEDKNNEENNDKNEEIEAQGNNEEDDTNVTEESNKYSVSFNYDKTLAEGESLSIVVETKTDTQDIHSRVHMSSATEANTKGLSFKSEEVNHILKENISPDVEEIPGDNPGGEDNPGGNDNPGGEDNPGGNDKPTNPTGVYTISGTAWLDKNENGRRDSDEETLRGIKVTLLNIEDNSSKNTTTGENGFYSFTEMPNGKYIAIFEYDTEKYVLTKYQAEGIGENRNSDVENVTMNIEGTSRKVASTDTIEIKENSVTNIDIGLIEAKTFDLSLDKKVTKVTVTNNAGTQTKEYNDTELAKTEIKAKYLKGTTVVIEYKIKVTNEGELAGYARKIVDYKPSDLTFNSSLNPDWYQTGEYLYTTSLANTKIEAGETKELTLILTKTMTETNTGLVNNTAEIEEDYNSLGIEDKDSRPGNKDTKEDDMGSANVIISVSTGAAISYVALTISIIVLIGVAVFIISKKILKENIKL